MTDYDERTCRYALNRIFGFRPAVSHALIDAFGSASAVFGADRKNLPPGAGQYFSGGTCISDTEYRKAENELYDTERTGAEFICDIDPRYPALLAECPDRPLGLFIRSSSPVQEIFHPERTYISIVGTRDPSCYGTEWCRRIVSALADCGHDVCIVSGLAFGCDITAHRAALDRGLPTIAVLPTGIDSVYPLRHSADARRILGNPRSALVTDYPPGTVPLKINFIRRNRIIAGLSSATVLIESRERGGGMITARIAFSYDRDVFALPGRSDDAASRGCNLLVREKIAEPVISEDSFLDSLGIRRSNAPRKNTDDRKIIDSRFAGQIDTDSISVMANILSIIRQERGIDITALADRCGTDYGRTLGLTALLESDGLISVDLMQRCSINVK